MQGRKNSSFNFSKLAARHQAVKRIDRFSGVRSIEKFNRLPDHGATIDAVESGNTLAEIRKFWSVDAEEVRARRAECLRYP